MTLAVPLRSPQRLAVPPCSSRLPRVSPYPPLHHLPFPSRRSLSRIVRSAKSRFDSSRFRQRRQQQQQQEGQWRQPWSPFSPSGVPPPSPPVLVALFSALSAGFILIQVAFFSVFTLAAIPLLFATLASLFPLFALSWLAVHVLGVPVLRILSNAVDAGLCLLVLSNFLSSLVAMMGERRIQAVQGATEGMLSDLFQSGPGPGTGGAFGSSGFADLGWERKGKGGWVGDRQWGSTGTGKGAGDERSVRVSGTGRRRHTSWMLPSAISLVPGANGVAWLALTSGSSGKEGGMSLEEERGRMTAVKNFLLYSTPGMVWGLKALLAKGGIAAAWLSGSAWAVSLLLSALHLQLYLRLRPGVGEEVRGDEEEEGEERRREEAEEDERRMKEVVEMKEFDRELMERQRVSSLEKPSSWSKFEVCHWLQQSGFASHVPAFLSHQVDGEVLLTLSEQEMQMDLGVVALGERKRLSAAIDRLRGS